MKKLITTIFTFSTLISFAQISYGVKAGYTNSTMKWKEEGIQVEFDPKASFYIGSFIENKISDKFSIQSEIIYTELGGKKSIEITRLIGSEIITEGRANIQYINKQIQVPLLAKYYFLPNFSLLGGLNVGLSYSGKFKTDYSNDYLQNGDVEDFKTISFYPMIGAEFEFYKKIFAEARYNFGLFDSAKSDAVNTYFNTFQIGLGYKFD